MNKRIGFLVIAAACFVAFGLARGQSTPPSGGGAYVATQAGWVWSTCIYGIPNGAGYNVDSGVVINTDGGYDGGYLLSHPLI
jgi:hypothetical protein